MTMKSFSRLKHGDTWDEAGQHVWKQSRERQNAGNGSMMRCLQKKQRECLGA
jgi:ADP-ribosyl-[dinitrogen reductase] hydrolase